MRISLAAFCSKWFCHIWITNRKARRAHRIFPAIILGLSILCGCKPKPCVSPVRGMVLAQRPVDRLPALPPDAPLEKAVEAAVLDRADWKSYAEGLEEILEALGAVKEKK